jgi:hypothetical protein
MNGPYYYLKQKYGESINYSDIRDLFNSLSNKLGWTNKQKLINAVNLCKSNPIPKQAVKCLELCIHNGYKSVFPVSLENNLEPKHKEIREKKGKQGELTDSSVIVDKVLKGLQ